MIVGRLPVGSSSELDIVLAKTLNYESPDASQFWRKRMIIVSDDQYSEGSSEFVLNKYCCKIGEYGFETGQENTAQIIENSLPAGYDVVRFYLAEYTRNWYPALPCGDPDNCGEPLPTWAFVRQGATEALLDEMNQGATLVTIQAHMNRSTATHERLLSTEDGTFLGGTGRDHLRVANRERPWIIVGMGCHFSDYTVFRELSDLWIANAPNGDAFAEQLLLQNEDRGAIGTYGSSGYEFLGANNNYMNNLTQIWFYEAPFDDMVNETQAEWKYGQLMFLVETRMVALGQRDPVERYHILGDPLLRIDAGPPAFNVTVNGSPVTTGDIVESGGEGDTIQVVAVVTDENAIHKFELEIDGIDMTDSLTVQQTSDPSLPNARQYQVSFAHKLRPENYDLVLRALQYPDTVCLDAPCPDSLIVNYSIAAEFLLRVESSIEVAVNGRVVANNGTIPSKGDYRIDLSFPVFVPGSEIGVFMDGSAVSPFTLNNPSPEDSLSWIITFQRTLPAGPHTLRVTAGPSIEFTYALLVSEDTGLRNVLNYPNPFRNGGTHFMFENEVEITNGSIDVFTVSGKRVRRLEIPPAARFPGQNAVFWDGRDGSGGELANGTYLYVIKVQQRGGSGLARGKVSKLN
jgi:hypothetical protein